MPLSSISTELSTRFLEVQDVLVFIKRNEALAGKPDIPVVVMLRGLFYVHLYGAFEFSVNRILVATAQVINAERVPHSRVCDTLGTLVLDGSFKSIKDSSRDKQWRRRLEHISLRLSSEIAEIKEGTIDLQNIWYNTLDELFDVFGVQAAVMYDVTKRPHINELVELRNSISHGRNSPIEKGRLKNSQELDKLYEVIRAQSFYVYDCFNDYLIKRRFMIS